MAKQINEIKTTGDLRNFLSQLLLDVKSGAIEPDKASKITKISSQINENFYAEIRVAKTYLESGAPLPDLGAIPINGPIPKK